MQRQFVADPLLGRSLGPYRVQSTLGRGNMGAIYRAVPEGGGPVVAVKMLHRAHLDDPELVERFERELANTARVQHPHVVRYLAHGKTPEGALWLAVAFLEGQPLAQVLQAEAPLPLARTLHLGAQVAAGLGAAHAAGVVHRDLKPENVMVQAEDHATLFDFGLARAALPDQPALTAADLRVGTPAYMAPEYIATGQLDHRSDLYALGVLLYELATGQVPFDGPPFKVLHHHVTRPAPRARDQVPTLPEALDALIDELLAKDPDRRPGSAEQVAERLRALR